MLRGHSTARMDKKGRLKVPSEFLCPFLDLCGDSRGVFVTSRDGQMILAYPILVWEEHEAKIAQLPTTDPAVETYLRAINFWGRESRIDAAGRILIHPLLRESASLDGEVSVFGKQKILEMCDFEQFRHKAPIVGPDDLAVLAKYGI